MFGGTLFCSSCYDAFCPGATLGDCENPPSRGPLSKEDRVALQLLRFLFNA